MSNWVDVQLDVLASSPAEINRIERALQEPCHELIAWCAQRSGGDPKTIVADIKGIVSFKPIRNLGYLDPSLNKARRFEGEWKDKFSGVGWSHVHFVSRNFPTAVFLAQYWDDQMSYDGKRVLHAGDEIRSIYDGDHHAQGREWVLPNIFAPFQSEYNLGLECGSLWDEWIEGMRRQLAVLTERYRGKGDVTVKKKAACGNGKQEQGEEE
jgi:hypothetical protein